MAEGDRETEPVVVDVVEIRAVMDAVGDAHADDAALALAVRDLPPDGDIEEDGDGERLCTAEGEEDNVGVRLTLFVAVPLKMLVRLLLRVLLVDAEDVEEGIRVRLDDALSVF